MAKEPTPKERIDYLVRRRFPLSYLLAIPPSINRGSGAPPDTRELRTAVEAFTQELVTLTSEALVARWNEEKGREFEQLRAKDEQEERERFFNQPHATANFVHWSKMAHWSLDEAVALSFGKAPELVNWATISKYLSSSRFAVEYAQRREIAMRAAQWKQLYDPVLPGIFLAWAERTDISVPTALTEAIEKRGVQIADWKMLHDKAVDAGKRDAEAAEKQIADWKRLLDESIAQLGKQRADWLEVVSAKNAEIAALKGSQSPQPAAEAERGIGARERDSLLKLDIGMAIAAYAYDPKAGRSDRPTEIAGDIERAGVPLDVDTVRKWLREAAELLPPNGPD